MDVSRDDLIDIVAHALCTTAAPGRGGTTGRIIAWSRRPTLRPHGTP